MGYRVISIRLRITRGCTWVRRVLRSRGSHAQTATILETIHTTSVMHGGTSSRGCWIGILIRIALALVSLVKRWGNYSVLLHFL